MYDHQATISENNSHLASFNIVLIILLRATNRNNNLYEEVTPSRGHFFSPRSVDTDDKDL